MAVKEGGGNPASNSKLATLIAKAKANSVPNDNIQRIIKRAEGGDKTEYEAITYEGYGPGGIAVMVETLTATATAPRPICAITLTSSAATWARWAVSASCSPRRASSSSISRTGTPMS